MRQGWESECRPMACARRGCLSGDAPPSRERGPLSRGRVEQRSADELILAAWEVVVDGAARRSGTLEHVAERRPLDPAHGEQGRGALDHLAAGVAPHLRLDLPLDYDGRHS